MPNAIPQTDAYPTPAPSAADLERWFAEDLADYQQQHNNALPAPVTCDLTDESWYREIVTDVQTDTAVANSPDSTDDGSNIVLVDPSFFNTKPIYSPITDATVMRQKLAKHAEERFRQGDKNLRALEGALLKLWLANGHTAGLTYSDVIGIALAVGQKLNAGESTSQLKGEKYPPHWRPASMLEIINREEEPLRYTIDGLLLDGAGHLTSGLPHASKSLGWLDGTMQAVIERKVWGKFAVSSNVKRALFIETEDPRILVETRVRQLARKFRVSEGELREAGFFLARTGPFDLVKSKDSIRALVDDVKPDMLVLSTLQGLLGGRDWTAQDEMADVNEFLVRLAEHVPTVVITHSPKDAKLRRSAGTITQEANYAIVSHFLKRPISDGPDKGKDKVNVVVDSKIYPVSPFDLLIDSENASTETSPDARSLIGVSLYGDPKTPIPSPGSGSKPTIEERRAGRRAKVVSYLSQHPDATIRDIADATDVSREYARRVKNEANQDAEDARVFGAGIKRDDIADEEAEE